MVLLFFLANPYLANKQTRSPVYGVYISSVNGTGGVVDDNVEPLINEETGLPVWDIIPPLRDYRYTQYYSARHRGVDIVSTDREVMAVDDGEVIFVGWNGGYGNQIQIRHSNGFISIYSHLSNFNVNMAQTASYGSIIGTMGNTGYSTGPHLHFELVYKGTKVNPQLYIE